MANLTEVAEWVEGLFRIETTTPVLGGEGGPLNAAVKTLGGRTRYLKAALEAAIASLTSSIGAVATGLATRTLSQTLAIGNSAGGRVISDLAAPVAATDAARKVDLVPVGSAVFEYTTPGVGTWVKPAGCTWVLVAAVGGGCGGARVQLASGPAGGGGAGYIARKLIRASELPATVTVTVGVGGAGATELSHYGSPGGTTSFGTYVSAAGAPAQTGGVNTGNGGDGSAGGGAASGKAPGKGTTGSPGSELGGGCSEGGTPGGAANGGADGAGGGGSGYGAGGGGGGNGGGGGGSTGIGAVTAGNGSLSFGGTGLGGCLHLDCW